MTTGFDDAHLTYVRMRAQEGRVAKMTELAVPLSSRVISSTLSTDKYTMVFPTSVLENNGLATCMFIAFALKSQTYGIA